MIIVFDATGAVSLHIVLWPLTDINVENPNFGLGTC